MTHEDRVAPAGGTGRAMTEQILYRVRLLLGEMVIEEYLAPVELAQCYIDVLKLRVQLQALHGRHVDWKRVYASTRPCEPRV